MIYTVAIGTQVISNVANISRVRTLDNSDDYASILLTKETAIESKQLKDVVTIFVSDGVDSEKHYFLIDSDISEPIDKDNQIYFKHEISLIELTSRLSDYTVGYRQFTNDDDTLYTIMVKLLKSLYMNNDLITDKSRQIVLDLTHSTLDILKNVPSRDFQFDNNTLRETLGTIFYEVGAIPRVIFENGVYYLSLDLENERKTLRTDFAHSLRNIKETNNINKYATNIESYVDNLVFDKTLVGASVFEPSANGFMPVISENAIFNSDNSVWKTRWNIRQVISAKLSCRLRTLDVADTILDVTDRLVNEEVYKGLPITNQFQADYSTQNGLIFYIEPTEGTVDFATGSTYVTTDTFKAKSKAGTLFFKDNIISNLYTNISTGTGLGGGEVIQTVIQGAAYDLFGADLSPDNFDSNQALYDFENLRLQIEYIPEYNSVLTVEKFNTEDVHKVTTMQTNQSASNVSTEKALKQLGGQINGLGNKERMAVDKLFLLADEYNIGDYTSDDFILSKKETTYFKNHFVARYEWNKNYQKRNEDIAIESAIRYYTVPAGGVSNRILKYREYVYIGFAGLTSETVLLDINGKETFTNVFEKSPTYNHSLQNAIIANEDVNNINVPILLPVISTGGHNVLRFDFGFQSPNIAGERLNTDGTIPLLEPIEYADKNAEVEHINWELVTTATVDEPKNLPLIPLADKGTTLVNTIVKKFLINKDSAETTSFAYELHLIPHPNIVIGDYLTSRNNLIETKLSFDDLVIYESDEYYRQNETKKVKGDLTAWNVSRTNNELVIMEGLVTKNAWAIATTDGDLVLAYNQFDGTKFQIPFNYFSHRFDVDYAFLGEGLITMPPATPTDLVVDVLNHNSIDLSWTDTSATETYFLIEISEDDIEYTTLDTVGTNETTYSVVDLTPETLYFFRVSSYNQGGTNGTYASGNGTTDEQLPVPTTPTNYIVVSGGETTLNASWTAVPNIDNYTIEIKKTIDEIYTTEQLTSDKVSHQFIGLDNGVSYDTRLKATNAQGSGSYATFTVSTDISEDAPLAPSNVQITVTSTSILNITWNDNSNNETGFRVQFKKTVDPNFTVKPNLPADTTTYELTGLDSGTSYDVRIIAFNDAGSVASETVAETTLALYTFLYNGGSGSNTTVIRTGVIGTTIVPPTPSQDTYYTFTGWSPTPPATHETLTTGGTSTAQYSYNPPTLWTYTWNYFGGSFTQDALAGTTLTTYSVPPRTGYTSSGWSPTPPNTMPSGGGSTNAQYTAIPQKTVTYNYWDGSTFGDHSSETNFVGSALTQTPTGLPESPGGFHSGWSPFYSTIQSTDVTMVAQYLP